MEIKAKKKNGSAPMVKLKVNKKRYADLSEDNECMACQNIKNAVCDPFITLPNNNIPHTCCDINDKVSRKKIELDIEIALLLRSVEREIIERSRKINLGKGIRK